MVSPLKQGEENQKSKLQNLKGMSAFGEGNYEKRERRERPKREREGKVSRVLGKLVRLACTSYVYGTAAS